MYMEKADRDYLKEIDLLLLDLFRSEICKFKKDCRVGEQLILIG